jgi:PTS system fructose-specific IIA component/PTS system nitrogen regulatory IIA component
MSDFVVPAAIVAELRATSKEGVIREMIDSLRANGSISPTKAEEIGQAVIRREGLGSTGIGRGVAIPHAKHNGVSRLTATVAISRPGVAFDSLDGEPVHIFVLLVSPPDQTGPHLRALERISRCLRDDSTIRSLRQAPTAEAIWALLEAADRHA